MELCFFAVSGQGKAKPITPQFVADGLVERIEFNERRRKERAPVVWELWEQLAFVLSLPRFGVGLLALEFVEWGAERMAHRICKLRITAALVFSDLRLIMHDVLWVFKMSAAAIVASTEPEAQALGVGLA